MCSHRARLTAGQTKVAEQAEQSTPDPAHLVLATSHLGFGDHSQSRRNRKCRNYDWQEEDDQRELERVPAGEKGVAEPGGGFHLEQKKVKKHKEDKWQQHIVGVLRCNAYQRVAHFCEALHTGRAEYWKTRRGDQMIAATRVNKFRGVLRRVRNLLWALSQHVPRLKQTRGRPDLPLVKSIRGRMTGAGEEREEKEGIAGATVPLAMLNTQKMP